MFQRLLIANRGEIAIRIARSAADRGVESVTIYSEDDAASPHVHHGDIAHALVGAGAAAYLDSAAIVAVGQAHGCDAVHPGYGFLSENAAFARACADAGMVFVGPAPDALDLFGDKSSAIALARRCGVPVIEGTPGAVTQAEAEAFLEAQGSGGAIMLKAISGGGGRGMRLVERVQDVASAFVRCQSEARRAFGQDALYAERYIRNARHIEVQIAGDGTDVTHLWERECTLQRQHQKLVEIAPAPNLPQGLRDRLLDAARTLASAAAYRNLGTFEFLIDCDRIGEDADFAFIEANPRLQVEHTVTEEIVGRDLVAIQFDLAAGKSLAEIDLSQADVPAPRGHAVQVRINMETMDASGTPRPATGLITTFDPPGGPGVRIDGLGRSGYRTVASFDSLLAKLIVHSSGDWPAALVRARRALSEFRIEGVSTNAPFLAALLARPEVAGGEVTTRFIADHIGDILKDLPTIRGPEIGLDDRLLAFVRAPMTGVISSLAVAKGDRVTRGADLLVLEAMKMEHIIRAEVGGIVGDIRTASGAQVVEGDLLLTFTPDADAGDGSADENAPELDRVRPELVDLNVRLARTLDESRPKAIARRRERGQRTVRENVADLLDPGSFVEYGQLAVAYRHLRHSPDELLDISPADGLVAGMGTINAGDFGAEVGSIAVVGYDATVFAGTQGHVNHKKTDRIFDQAGERGIPVVLFAEGGGGRPGDDSVSVAGLGTPTFRKLARLSGQVPLVGIVSGRCFAGNAALLGITDTIIATENSTIGMGGPALIEPAGLGSFTPEEVGPVSVQTRNGVIDIRVADEAEAVATAKRYLGYFQGRQADWQAHDLRLIRQAVPENRLRAYDVRDAGRSIADIGSWLELRAGFGQAYVTALARVEGRPVGVIANNPMVNAGAIDSDGADKAARFLRLCNAHGLPVLSLIDTPGIMVGPEAEKTALVRHAARLFAASASLRVPIFAVVLRKAYGLGAMAAAGGSFQAPFFTVAWPTGEMGGMGLEGSVMLGLKKELEAIADPAERDTLFRREVAIRYERGKASSIASHFEVDAVIDPADTRAWIRRGLDATAAHHGRRNGGFIDTW